MAKIKFTIPRNLVIPFFVSLIAIFSIIVGLISKGLGAKNPNAWGFFTGVTIIGSYILFIWGRQLWWYISGTGDYIGRNGLLKRLWKKIFN